MQPKQQIVELMKAWRMNPDQAAFLAKVEPLFFQEWLAKGDPATLPVELLPIQNLIALRLKLQKFFSDDEAQCTWLMSPSPDFAEQPPLNFVSQNSEALQWVNYFLETRFQQERGI